LAWEKAGKFPKAVRLSANKRVWWSADVNNWIREKLEEAGHE
jgi:predicted DNA-binding transcriptional regulator AlpA